jgi:hypothetical protein
MTEAEWLASVDLRAMLHWLGETLSARKSRLLACAWGRLCWPGLPDRRSRQAISAAEHYLEGQTTLKEVQRAGRAARAAVAPANDALLGATPNIMGDAGAWHAARAAWLAAYAAQATAEEAGRKRPGM